MFGIAVVVMVPLRRNWLCVKSVGIQSFSWCVCSYIRIEYGDLRSKANKGVFSPNSRKYRPEKTPYLDTFHVV